jgi:hypothetical protein
MKHSTAESSKKNLVLRNSTILSIVKPLVGFVRKLPVYTLSTDNRITTDAKAVRKVILEAKEPNQFLFNYLRFFKSLEYPVESHAH